MIATVTRNLALDVRYAVPEVRRHAANRVTSVHERAGGKGVNVSRMLHPLGHATVVCGLFGGPNDGMYGEPGARYDTSCPRPRVDLT